MLMGTVVREIRCCDYGLALADMGLGIIRLDVPVFSCGSSVGAAQLGFRFVDRFHDLMVQLAQGGYE